MEASPLISGIAHLPFGPVQAATLGAVPLVRSYDQRYNVDRIKAGGLDFAYSRDAGGHVTGIAGIQTPTVASDQSDYSYNPANNQLTATTGAAAKAPVYDAGGNMVADGTLIFAYDGLNRLVRVEKDGATVATYGYDSANRRISKTIAGVTTHYLYDLSSQFIAETLTDGTMLREYIYLDGEPMVMKEYQTNPGTYYFINDHLGTPQQLITATGAIVWQAAYLPFGQAQIKTATVTNNLRFAGQYFDVETGLHYNWNRYYDPEVGRYVTADPIGLDVGMNLYAYVGGNPVNGIDPEGLFLLPIIIIPEKFVLQTPQVIWPPHWYQIAQQYRDWANQMWPRIPGDPNDPMRHCVTSCMIGADIGVGTGRTLGFSNEVWGFIRHDFPNLRDKISNNGPWAFQSSDLMHNEMGFRCAKKQDSCSPQNENDMRTQCIKCCQGL